MDRTEEMNQGLIAFWNQAIALDEEAKLQADQISPVAFEELAPSAKLTEAIAELSSCKALDYGCGNGWASIIAAKKGCQDIDAVDLGDNVVEAANFYAGRYGVGDIVHAKAVDADWIASSPENVYDGLVSINVLDVVPIETAKEIIRCIDRVTSHGAKVIIGMNFYLSKEMAEQRKMELIDGTYLFVNGVLRLNRRSDEEWINEFKPYFEIEKLDYYSWPGETKETRRLFRLRKQA